MTEVVTIELDPLMVYLQRANPWSSELFDDPKSAHKTVQVSRGSDFQNRLLTGARSK